MENLEVLKLKQRDNTVNPYIEHIQLKAKGSIFEVTWDETKVYDAWLVMVDECILRLDYKRHADALTECLSIEKYPYETPFLKCENWNRKTLKRDGSVRWYNMNPLQAPLDDESSNLSKNEAIAAMKRGCKIRHTYFSPNEYIFMIDGNIRDEQGLILRNFWMYRTAQLWQTGWIIVN